MAQHDRSSLMPYAPAAWAAVCGVAASGLDHLTLGVLFAPVSAWLAADIMMGAAMATVRAWLTSRSQHKLLLQAIFAALAAVALSLGAIQVALVLLAALVLGMIAALLPLSASDATQSGLRVAASWLAAQAALGALALPSVILGLAAGLMTSLRTARGRLVPRALMAILWAALSATLFVARQPQLAVPVVVAGIIDIGLSRDLSGPSLWLGWSVTMLVGALASVYWNA